MSEIEPRAGAAGDEREGAGGGRRRGRGRRRLLGLLGWLGLAAVVALAVVLIAGTPWPTTFGALLLGAVILRTGWFFLQSFATPPPPPPEPGTLRRVKLVYRCESCGAELRMTMAATEDPEPPRHCMEEMELVSGTED